MPTLAHLTCVSSTKDTVKQKIQEIKAAGIENIMALRGDIPEILKDSDRSKWDYKYAIDLARGLKSVIVSMGVIPVVIAELIYEYVAPVSKIMRRS